jgi:hypothetical protein
MRDSAADGSEDMEAVKSMIGEWSATYAAVADRSASINSSQNEVFVALTKRRADIDAFKELFGPNSGGTPRRALGVRISSRDVKLYFPKKGPKFSEPDLLPNVYPSPQRLLRELRP